MKPQILPWCNPLDLANSFGAQPLVLLHSSVQTSYSGRLSLLAVNKVESVDIDSFDALSSLLAQNKQRFEQCWFGYLGYEMRHDCEHYTPANAGRTRLPRGRLMRFADVYVFDHDARTLTLWSENPQVLPTLHPVAEFQPIHVSGLSSNMSRAEYETKVASIIDEIHAGSLYQANLTRKFYGQWESAPDGLALFARLCQQSPAPYSSYLRMEEAEILSSSPELFLRVDADGIATTRPIKGSAPRGKTPAEDASIRHALENSAKNRAENLMITDLMRSDLAKSCVDGSVSVSGLFDVTAHATIFHMASTISGTLEENATLGELLRATFPAGSMTGAPKIRAVELCTALEGVERGVYSGAIGWFGGDGACELSVVIRTLIVQRENFEFQVGGGIVADSTPAGEWQETMDKSLGIIKTLAIPRSNLEAL